MSGALSVVASLAGAPGTINMADVFNSAGAPRTFDVNADGTYDIGSDTAISYVVPATAGIAAFYQVKVDVTAGAFSSGSSTGTWIDCSSAPSWVKSAAGTVSFDVSFREKATGLARGTFSCSMQVL